MQKDVCVSSILNVYQNDTLKWHRSEPRERNRAGLVLFTEGEIEYFFPNESIVATRGSLMLFPSNIPYHGIARTKRVAYCVLDFETLSPNELCKLGAPCIAVPQNFEELQKSFSNLVAAWDCQRMDAAVQAKAFLYATLGQIIGNDGKNQLSQQSSEILAYIFQHYTDPELSVLHLCKQFYISESQLRRNILRATGLSTNEYITSLRINRAKRELTCTKKSVKQIACECGFSSAYYFSRCFHQHTQISPKEYRQSNLML